MELSSFARGTLQYRRVVGAAFLLAMLCGAASLPASAQTAGPEKRIFTGPQKYYDARTAFVGPVGVAMYSTNGYTATEWSYTLDGGVSWQVGAGLPLPPPALLLYGQPSVLADAQGNFYLAVRGVLNLSEGSKYAVLFYRGAVVGSTVQWQGPYAASPPVDVGAPKSHDVPYLALDPGSGALYLSYTRSPYGATERDVIYRIEFVRSLDGGFTWSAPIVLSGPASTASRVVVGPDGGVHVAWEDLTSGRILCANSTDHGASFASPVAIAPSNANFSTQFPGWSPQYERVDPRYPSCSRAFAPDFPSLAVDNSTGPNRGSLYCTWSEMADGTSPSFNAYGGEQEPNDTPATANKIIMGQGLEASVVGTEFNGYDTDWFYFDGVAGTMVEFGCRLQAAEPFPDYTYCKAYVFFSGTDPSNLVALNGANSWGLYYGERTPPMILSLPRTGRYYINVHSGEAWTSYYLLTLRAFNPTPGSASRDQRDVVMTCSKDGGLTWSPKKLVNDDPVGYDSAMPEVGVDAMGNVGLVWADRRDDPGRGYTGRVYGTVSVDGGNHFMPSIPLSTAAGFPQGDHLAIGAQGSNFYVSWGESRLGNWGIYGAPLSAPLISAIAVSNFQAERAGGKVLLSWHAENDGTLTGFVLERSLGVAGPFEPVGAEVPARRGASDYQAQDPSPPAAGMSTYRLMATGNERRELARFILGAAAPVRLAWENSGANPVSSEFRAAISFPKQGRAEVAAYNTSGSRVATLLAEQVAEGTTEPVNDFETPGFIVY